MDKEQKREEMITCEITTTQRKFLDYIEKEVYYGKIEIKIVRGQPVEVFKSIKSTRFDL